MLPVLLATAALAFVAAGAGLAARRRRVDKRTDRVTGVRFSLEGPNRAVFEFATRARPAEIVLSAVQDGRQVSRISFRPAECGERFEIDPVAQFGLAPGAYALKAATADGRELGSQALLVGPWPPRD